MRKRKQENKLTLQAIAGTHVVALGWDMEEADSQGVLGFAIRCTDHTENETYYLRGIKTFEDTDLGLAPGNLYSTRRQPLQTFTWSDLTAQPGHSYTYRVVALRGTPADLQKAESAEVSVTAEPEGGDTQVVWFNRGATGSQDYARDFHNQDPDAVGDPAWEWLSRGLKEAMLRFIAQAQGAEWGLRVAAYEFEYEPVLEALHQAHSSGADVQIVYDARDDGVAAANREAAQRAGIEGLCRERTKNKSAISHNKFIVLLHGGAPVAVWTGSTNLTERGIFGHSNVGHSVEDAPVAQAYLDYWDQLHTDPKSTVLRPWDTTASPTPAAGSLPAPGTTAFFSPRSSLDLLEWYIDLAEQASSLLCITFPFGISAPFDPMLEVEMAAGLRYALLDAAGNQKGAKDKIDRLRSLTSNLFAIGNRVSLNTFDRWLKEKYPNLNKHAIWVHTKYMLVDPLGDDPIVVTGSANFSPASVEENDENMLVIRGNRRVADIYLTEFFRLWKHHAFREWAAKAPSAATARPQYLKPDDTWRAIYYDPARAQSRQRQLFAGTL